MNIINSRLLAILIVFLLGATNPLWSKEKPNDHLHGLDRCVQCHLNGVDISKLSNRLLNLGNQINVYVTNLASGKYQQQAGSDTKQLNHHHENPYYYNETKYGAEPNPMVTIPAGKFTMGTDERLSDEGPQHEVYLDAFKIDKYEVTNLQYKKFIDETGRRSPSHFRNRTYPEGKVDHPVTFVSWQDAKAYCEWAGKRLPTDKEWEKAARGTDGRTYPWGNDFAIENANTPIRWQSLDKFGDTLPIGAFPKGVSPYGLYDMSGNVWEWTESWYQAYPGNKTFSESYGERYKTLKGGSWFDCSFYKCGISAPAYNRAFFAEKVKNDTFGFRCAKDIKDK